MQAFRSRHPDSAQSMSAKMLKKAVCTIKATKLLDKVFQKCRKQAGMLLATCRSIKQMVITNEGDFGDGLHYEEPMYYDAVYCLWPNVQPLPINVDGECVLAEKVMSMNKDIECNGNSLTHYKCSTRCKQLTEDEVCLYCPLDKYLIYQFILAHMCIIVMHTNLIKMVLRM